MLGLGNTLQAGVLVHEAEVHPLVVALVIHARPATANPIALDVALSGGGGRPCPRRRPGLLSGDQLITLCTVQVIPE